MKKLFRPLFLIALFGATSLLLWCGLTNDHNWGGDFAAYIMQAQSVVEDKQGEFVDANRFTIEKSSITLGPVTYPWGVPVLLVPFYAYFGMDILALKSVNVICYLLFLLSLWFGFRGYHTDLWRVILISLFAINPYFISFINRIQPDIPFLFFSTLSVILIGKIAIEKRWIISEASDHLLLGVIISLSFFMRQNGILLLVALSITQLLRTVEEDLSQIKTIADFRDYLTEFLSSVRRQQIKKIWISILPYVSFVITVTIWQAVFNKGGEGTPGQFLKGVSLASIIGNLYGYIGLTAEFFSALPHYKIVFGASIPLAIAGMFKRSNSDYHIIVYGGLTLLLFLIFPFGAHQRYLFPLLPFYISFVLTGLETSLGVSQWKWRGPYRILLIGPPIVIVLFLGIQTVKDVTKNLEQDRVRFDMMGPYQPTSQDVFSFISKNTEPSSVILFYKPRVMRLFANRQSIQVQAVDRLRDGDYLCLYEHGYGQVSEDDVRRLLEDRKIYPVYQNIDFQLYRIEKP